MQYPVDVYIIQLLLHHHHHLLQNIHPYTPTHTTQLITLALQAAHPLTSTTLFISPRPLTQ